MADLEPPAGSDAGFSPADRRQLAGRGISTTEAIRQLAVLADPPGFARLDRPCTVGDGVERWDGATLTRLAELADGAAAGGRLSSFVPASGAATRMFKELLAWRARPGALPAAEAVAASDGDAEARAVAAWWEGLERFAFWPALRGTVGAVRGADSDLRPWLDGLLGDGDGALRYASLPKGLLAFHRTASGVRTAVEEQLVDAAAVLAGGAAGAGAAPARMAVGRVHLTVSPEHRDAFERCFAEARAGLEAVTGVTFALTMSEQDPSTDTLAGAVTATGEPAPFRGSDGELVFRPAGHGALIGNLARCGGDLVLLKNVDNVATGAVRDATVAWARALFGRLVELTVERDRHLAAFADAGDGSVQGDVLDEARRWLASTFGTEAGPGEGDLRRALDRPVRVAGMVPNTGEPGGGPFWVRADDGRVTRQIVESAEVDVADPEQLDVLRRSTHFNPVFLAVSLRDAGGQPYDLDAFVDPEAVITTRKSSGGRELLALERPGLWNGAMARWNTVFVEVPLDVFNPVKTVLDLLRPAHQPAD